MDGYITIAEAASRANITKQAAYQRIKSTWKPFVKEVEGRKYLNVKALEESDSSNVDQVFNNVEQASLIATMNRTIELLQKQLEIKDSQIQNLNDRLEQALKNSSEGHFILAQSQHKELNGVPDHKESFLKRLFGKGNK